MKNSNPNLRNVVETLVENGATYVAAEKDSLANKQLKIYYHRPTGVPEEQNERLETYLAEKVGHQPHDRQVGGVQIADQIVPTAVWDVLQNQFHLYNRTPLYIPQSIPGLDPVSIEDGVSAARDIVETQPEIEPHPSETVKLGKLVRELADAGAASVELDHTLLVAGESPVINLRIPIVPADGKSVTGPIDSVKLGGETYPLRTTLTLTGPGGHTVYTSLYIADNVRGLNHKPAREGIEQARELVKKAADAETLREFNQSQVQ